MNSIDNHNNKNKTKNKCINYKAVISVGFSVDYFISTKEENIEIHSHEMSYPIRT